MSSLNRTEIEAAEAAREEAKSEVKFADRLLESWAYDSRNTGLPRTTTRCTLAAYRPGELMSVAAARSRLLELDDRRYLEIDLAIGRLTPALRRVVFIEYQQGGTQRRKAKGMHLSHLEYRERLTAARWAVYVGLMPDVLRWRREVGDL